MKIRFWGVRGSIPIPGPGTVRYGGNTSCVEVRPAAGPLLVFDAGTGLRRLGKELMQAEFGAGKGVAHLLISHTHWDHIQGLPFFSPLYVAGNRLYVYARQRDVHLRAVFASQTEAPYFPVPLDEAKAEVSFRELFEGACFELGEAGQAGQAGQAGEFRTVTVSTARLNHPWAALAYAVAADGAKVCYVSDTGPFDNILFGEAFMATPPAPGDRLPEEQACRLAEMRQRLVELCRGADLLIYDSMFTPAEYAERPHFGHSRPDDAIEIARAAGARKVAFFHHAPERTDDQLDRLVAEYRALAPDLELVAAAEGLEIELGRDQACLAQRPAAAERPQGASGAQPA
jgi:phosphoribosyl 1,2-cyclic phosphodiesterase